MILESCGISITRQFVGITLPVDPLVMMPHHRSDLGVTIDVRQDTFADLGVTLHFTPLVERQRTRLLEQARRQTDLSDVVDQAAEVRERSLIAAQLHPLSDVTGVDRNSR